MVELPANHLIHVSWAALGNRSLVFSVGRVFDGIVENVCVAAGLEGSCSFTSQVGSYRLAFSPVFPSSAPSYALSYTVQYSVPFL